MKTKLTKVIAIMNQKGGVGKTATTDTVARDLAMGGYNILLVDFDPQMSLTKQFNVNPTNIINTVQDSSTVFVNNKFPQPKKVTVDSNETVFLDMLFASTSLIEHAQSGISARELKLKAYLKKIKKENIYDFIVIDTAGSFGVLFNNAALSADTIILPIATVSSATDATEPFFKELAMLSEQFDHDIEEIIFFGNMFNSVTSHDKEQLEIINNEIPNYLQAQKEINNFVDLKYNVIKEIPNRTAIKDASGNHMYLREYIKLYANNKSNKSMLTSYDEIFNILTKQGE